MGVERFEVGSDGKTTRVPVYVDPETGMWRASTDIDGSQFRSYAKYAVTTHRGLVYEERVDVEKQPTKKRSSKKKQTSIDLEKTIHDIIRKYLVVRNGVLGAEVYVPASKVPELIKDIAQLVNDYIAAEMKKYKDKVKTAEKSKEEIKIDPAKIWEEFQKQMEKTQEDYQIPQKPIKPLMPERPWVRPDNNPYKKYAMGEYKDKFYYGANKVNG